MFREVEQPALRPLPAERFPLFHEARRIGPSRRPRRGRAGLLLGAAGVPGAARSGSAGTRGWCGSSISGWSRSPCTPSSEPGQFSTQRVAHRRGEDQRRRARRGLALAEGRAASARTPKQWAEAMLAARGVEGVRVLQGLSAWRPSMAPLTVERACEVAQSYGAYRLRTIRAAREAARTEQASSSSWTSIRSFAPCPTTAQLRIARSKRTAWRARGKEQQDPQVPSPEPPSSFPSFVPLEPSLYRRP